MLRMHPDPAVASINGIACLHASIGPRTLMAIVRSHTSIGVDTTSMSSATQASNAEALLSRMSRRPKRPTVSEIAARIASPSDTSTARAMPLPPRASISATTAAAPAVSTSTTATAAPAAAMANAVARPMPFAAPVTIATRPPSCASGRSGNGSPARSGVDDDVERLGAVLLDVCDAHPLEAGGEAHLPGREAVEHLLQHDLAGHAGEVVAEAEVRAGAERHVLGLLHAVHVVHVGVRVRGLVAPGRGDAHHDVVTSVHRAAADLGLRPRRAHQERDRRLVAQRFLHRARNLRPIGAQLLREALFVGD